MSSRVSIAVDVLHSPPTRRQWSTPICGALSRNPRRSHVLSLTPAPTLRFRLIDAARALSVTIPNGLQIQSLVKATFITSCETPNSLCGRCNLEKPFSLPRFIQLIFSTALIVVVLSPCRSQLWRHLAPIFIVHHLGLIYGDPCASILGTNWPRWLSNLNAARTVCACAWLGRLHRLAAVARTHTGLPCFQPSLTSSACYLSSLTLQYSAHCRSISTSATPPSANRR
jgi:hypothetical protein